MTQNKVLLILVDGMRPDSIPLCGNHPFQNYFETGAYTYTAQTTYPPVTLPAHMSLFHSVKTERHGVWTNTFVPQNHPITGLFETLDAAKKRSAVFYSWQPLQDMWTGANSVSFSWMMNLHNYRKTMNVDIAETEACKAHITAYAPDFVWLYLGMVDEFGHDFGWMSPEYLESVRIAADCCMDMVNYLPLEYSVIITADHGGHERNHGDNVPEDMTIPLSCHGSMFESGKVLKDVNIIDIAPTITDILGIVPDPDWEGRSLAGRRF